MTSIWGFMSETAKHPLGHHLSSTVFNRATIIIITLPNSPVWNLDDKVCELHALEGHRLPLHACAGTINESLRKKRHDYMVNRHSNEETNNWNVCRILKTHPVLVNNIYDGHQLASMGSKRDVGDTADLNEALEHLWGTGFV